LTATREIRRESRSIERVGRFAGLTAETDVSLFAALRYAQGTHRPLGSDEFIKELQGPTGRRLRLQKPGASQVNTT
jgi:hypothetical protein